MRSIILYLLAAIAIYPIANFFFLHFPEFRYEVYARVFISWPLLVIVGMVLMKTNTSKLHKYLGALILVGGFIAARFILDELFYKP